MSQVQNIRFGWQHVFKVSIHKDDMFQNALFGSYNSNIQDGTKTEAGAFQQIQKMQTKPSFMGKTPKENVQMRSNKKAFKVIHRQY